MTIILDTPEATVIHGDWRETLAVAQERGGVDALIVDAPYSERTHAGHCDGVDLSTRGGRYRKSDGTSDTQSRRRLHYSCWDDPAVEAFAAAASPLVRGWIVALGDTEMAWRRALDTAGRYAFAPVPCCISGMTVRLAGDGPSSEAVYAYAARPRDAAAAKWGTLRGYYEGPSERQSWIGGKPLWLMLALVRDYSRRGDLVCDPCSGGGTTARAARILGRRFIGGDIDLAAAKETARVVSAAREQLPLALGAE